MEGDLQKEDKAPRMAELAGGPEDGSMVMVDMPFWAKTFIGQGVYCLKEDGKLHFLKEDTEKYLAKLKELQP